MPSFEDLQRINKANSIINRSNISIGVRPMYLHAQEEEQEEQAQYEEEFYEEELEEDFNIEEVEVSEFEKDKKLSQSLKNDIREKLLETQSREIVTAEEYYAQRNENLEEDFLIEDNEEDFLQTQNFYQEQEIQEQEEYIDENLSHNGFQKKNFFDANDLNSEPLFETAAKLNTNQTLIQVPSHSPLSFSKTVLYTACTIIAAVCLVFTFKPVSTAPVQEASFEETKLQELTKTVSSTAPRSLIITSGNFLQEPLATAYQKSLKDKLGVPLKVVKQGKTYSIQIGPAYANHDDALMVFDELSRYSVKNLSIKVAS